MGLDDFIPSETPESGAKSAEVSEKIKEGIKKGTAGVKRVQKDEKKAQKYDKILAGALAEIIKNKKYDFLLKDIFKLLDEGYSSSFVLGILSLIYEPISFKIRKISNKEQINFKYNKTLEQISFNDNNLDNEIKNRINYWIEDIIDILSIEYSNMQISRLKNILNNKELKKDLVLFLSIVFIFFFEEININIGKTKAFNYSEFILEQIIFKINEINIDNI